MPGRHEQKLVGLRQTGFTSLTSLGQMENGLPLCPLCHAAYDELPCPGWTFFPADLGFFLTEEQKDFRRRIQSCREQRSIPMPIRQPATGTSYFENQRDVENLSFEGAEWGSYRTHIVNSFGPYGLQFPKERSIVKPWHGDPMVALRHSFAACSEDLENLPEELKELRDLYQINDSKIRKFFADPATIEAGSDSDIDDDEGEKSRNDDKGRDKSADDNSPGSKTTEGSSRRQSARIDKKGEGTSTKQSQGPGQHDALVMLSPSGKPVLQEEPFARLVPCKRAYETPYGKDWHYGPESTAQQAIHIYSLFKSLGYSEDSA
ncbi:MAG: hypothetical protein Q9219_007454 [cf. Caloplaca sp. 3 TL-2023]